MLELRKPRTEQPQDWADIDRSTPAGAAISTLIPFGGRNFDLVTGNRVTFGAGGSIQPTQRGLSLRGSGASARASIPIDLSAHRILSLSFWMYWDAFANDDLLAMEFTANTNSNNGGFHIDPNCGAPVAGVFQCAIGDSGASSTASFARPSATAWHHYAFVFDRNVVSGSGQPTMRGAWVDGVSQTVTNRTASYAIATNFASSTLYFLSRGGSSLLATGNLQNVVLRAGYKLSDAEVLNEYLNPWGLFEPQQILVPTALPSSGASGTLATTNANDTSSAAGTTTVTGTLARTNANDTAAASGSPVVNGSLARTNANDTVAASGSVGGAISGTSSTTNANDTSAAAGTTTVVGSLAKTNSNDTSAASGATTIVGTLARTNANDTVVASGAAGNATGTVNYTNNNDTVAASGTAGNPGGGYYDDKPAKRRFVVKVGNKLVEYRSATAAMKALDKDETDSVDATNDAVEATEAPIAEVKIAEVKSLAKTYKAQAEVMDLFKQQGYSEMVALYERLKAQQDEDDVEILLLSL